MKLADGQVMDYTGEAAAPYIDERATAAGREALAPVAESSRGNQSIVFDDVVYAPGVPPAPEGEASPELLAELAKPGMVRVTGMVPEAVHSQVRSALDSMTTQAGKTFGKADIESCQMGYPQLPGFPPPQIGDYFPQYPTWPTQPAGGRAEAALLTMLLSKVEIRLQLLKSLDEQTAEIKAAIKAYEWVIAESLTL
jgi:hypothetical protein